MDSWRAVRDKERRSGWVALHTQVGGTLPHHTGFALSCWVPTNSCTDSPFLICLKFNSPGICPTNDAATKICTEHAMLQHEKWVLSGQPCWKRESSLKHFYFPNTREVTWSDVSYLKGVARRGDPVTSTVSPNDSISPAVCYSAEMSILTKSNTSMWVLLLFWLQS